MLPSPGLAGAGASADRLQLGVGTGAGTDPRALAEAIVAEIAAFAGS